MTPFDFVFALISIISSLALTHIITGVVQVIRHKGRTGFSLNHALWVWIAFAVVLGNWGALWGANSDPGWPWYRVLAWVASMTSLYAFCALVVPELERGEPFDLDEFHASEGWRYIIAHNVFAALAVLLVVTVTGLGDAPARNLIPPILAFLFGSLALFTRGRLQLAASFLVGVVATMFMIASISILSTGNP